MNLLGVFKSLRMKSGFVLRAYQYRSGGNGNGVIWAMPIDAPFLQPSKVPKLMNGYLEPPKPPEALDGVMEAIDGDGTPWSSGISHIGFGFVRSATPPRQQLAHFDAIPTARQRFG